MEISFNQKEGESDIVEGILYFLQDPKDSCPYCLNQKSAFSDDTSKKCNEKMISDCALSLENKEKRYEQMLFILRGCYLEIKNLRSKIQS